MRYLRVTVEGPYDTTTVYEALDPLAEYSVEDLLEISKDLANNIYTWGYSVVDESEVPEDDRPDASA